VAIVETIALWELHPKIDKKAAETGNAMPCSTFGRWGSRRLMGAQSGGRGSGGKKLLLSRLLLAKNKRT